MKIEGRNAVLELLKTDKEIDKLLMQRGAEGSAGRIFALAREKNIRVQFADARALERESESGRHQGVIAYVSEYAYADLDEIISCGAGRLVVLCDGIEDVHNLGSILRVAECCGAAGVVIPKNKSAQVTGAVVRISEGAAGHIKVARVPGINYAIDKLKENGFWVYGLEADGEDLYGCDLTGSAALVVGGEDRSIAPLTRKKCDKILSLPLFGKVNSLNASVALGIAAYEAVRQRR